MMFFFLDGDGHSRWEVGNLALLSFTHRRRLLPSFVNFPYHDATKPKKTVVIFGACMSTTLLLAIHNDTIQITNGTDAGRPSLWQHLAGMQKTDYIPVESTFSRVMGRKEYRLAWALVCHMNRLDHGITYTAYTYHITLTTRTTYHIQTSRHRQRRGTIRNED